MKLSELFEQEDLPQDVIKAFVELGNLQRGDPEIQMLQVQKANSGGGVLNFVVEHAGDLIHRMSHMAPHAHNTVMGREYIVDKTKKVHDILASGYGFEKEMEENFQANSQHLNIPVEQLKEKVFRELAKYGELHSQLPAYNHVQAIAREICIYLGQRNFDGARLVTKVLHDIATDESRWMREAMSYEKDASGKIKKLDANRGYGLAHPSSHMTPEQSKRKEWMRQKAASLGIDYDI